MVYMYGIHRINISNVLRSVESFNLQIFDEACREKGSSILEAPITGGMDALKKGQMAVWVAGDKEAYLEVGEIQYIKVIQSLLNIKSRIVKK